MGFMNLVNGRTRKCTKEKKKREREIVLPRLINLKISIFQGFKISRKRKYDRGVCFFVLSSGHHCKFFVLLMSFP